MRFAALAPNLAPRFAALAPALAPRATPAAASLLWRRAAPAIVTLVPKVHDCGPAAITFFNNFRVPASLLAASALKDAFVMDSPPKSIATSRAWRLVRYIYLLLMTASFTFTISSVFVATQATVRLQAIEAGRLHATSVTALLVRELEFEYVAVRCEFILGLLAFVAAQSLRLRLALRKMRDLSMAAMFMLLSMTFQARPTAHISAPRAVAARRCCAYAAPTLRLRCASPSTVQAGRITNPTTPCLTALPAANPH